MSYNPLSDLIALQKQSLDKLSVIADNTQSSVGVADIVSAKDYSCTRTYNVYNPDLVSTILHRGTVGGKLFKILETFCYKNPKYGDYTLITKKYENA